MYSSKFIGILLIMATFFVAVSGLTSAQAQSYSASYKFIKAIKEVNYKDIKVAVEKGVNINTRDYDDKKTALIIATRKKELPLVKYLLGNGAKPNLVGKDGKTALVIAAEAGNRAMVDVLIEAGADLDLADKNGTTPLIAAVLVKRDKIVELLIKGGADFTLEDYSGRSPLQHAIDHRRSKTEKILRDAGARH